MQRLGGGDGKKRAEGGREGTAVPETPLAFQGDPGKGYESPREVELKTRDLLVLARDATELNMSFVPPSPGRWRELGQAGWADSPLRTCFAHSPGIWDRDLQAHKSLKNLLQAAGQPARAAWISWESSFLSEGRLAVPSQQHKAVCHYPLA